MKKKFINSIFYCICFSLIFNNIPKAIQMNFIGGLLGNKLVFYPLIIGLLYTALHGWRDINVFKFKNEFCKFICGYVCITLLSLVTGLFFYPYYSDIVNGPIVQIEKLPYVLSFLSKNGITIQPEFLVPFWMIIRMIKGFFLEILYTFGGAYLIFCWYHDDWRTCFKIVCNAVLVSLAVIFAYSILLEVPYLSGNKYCTKILESINPLIHEIKTDGKWWPPLLWKGQLRSVFAEPSYFGIYASFAMPFLWYKVFRDKQSIWSIVVTVFTFLLFLTKARTGFLLFLGEVCLLILLVLFVLRQRLYIKKLCVILLCSLVAFVCCNMYISHYMNIGKSKSMVSVVTNMGKPQKPAPDNMNNSKVQNLQKSTTEYIEKNVTSITNPDKRSNRARYSIMEADFRIGLDHPILGVGKGLRNGYIPQYLPEKGKQNAEVKMWLSFRKKLGILKSGFPPLGEYTSRFGETGIFGLSVFLLPAVLLIFSIAKKLLYVVSEDKAEHMFLLIALLGVMASGIGDTINITYCYWTLLGLGYAMCFGKVDEEKELDERA